MPRINIRHDIVPATASSDEATISWIDVKEWSQIAKVEKGAAAMSAYTFRTFPTWQSPAAWAGFEVIMSGGSVRLCAIVYDAEGKQEVISDWGPEFDCPVGVRSGQMPITKAWNKMCRGPTDRMFVFTPEVKGKGLLFRAQLNLIYDL